MNTRSNRKASAMGNSLKLVLILLTLSLALSSSFSAATTTQQQPSESLSDAIETLSNSGYTSMSLTLHLITSTLPPFPTTLTIFSPPDTAFASSGQPTLSQLLLHLSPLSLSFSSLLSLPLSSTIPSLSPSHHLTVTTSQETGTISINNVQVSQTPLFDDGLVLVYATDAFFDLNFTLTLNTTRLNSDRSLDFQCLKLERDSMFGDASGVLRSRGYTIMASFLELQLMGYYSLRRHSSRAAKWTVFAPVDGELVPFSGDFGTYKSLLMRHLVPCRVGWGDLEVMANGTVVSINVEGFGLEVTRDEDDEMLMVNGVEITAPNMYDSDWLVVHGIKGLIELPESEGEEMDLTAF